MPQYKIMLLLLLPIFSFKTNSTYPVKWILTKACSLKVNGSTNVNKFSCIIPEYTQPDTLTIYKGNGSELVKISGSMTLDVKSFNCHNPVMTSDLRKALKAKAFPKITIRLLSLSKYPDFNDKEETIKGAVTIELAGTTKRFEVDYSHQINSEGNLKLVGTKQVNFSDFNIVPPRKMGGMIKSHDELNVEFILSVKELR